MSDKNRIWRLMFPIALLALVIGTTFGEVWHRHIHSSAETCPICQLSHQAIEPPVESAGAHILFPTGPGPEPQHYSFTPNPAARHIPARAPPA